ncbi:MAG TPA: lipid A deacylase LpxR family protein [Burkholderiaceae bacterium]|nr:lipid A deacylase LpxR family protein [Burkholderiaceae bacterium]HQR75282.1 lipid A deacylase LpxR family protein [Burkholderiaceae bacterium]
MARAEQTQGAGAFSVAVENDVLSGTDRGYTNGIVFTWVPPAGSAPEWAGRLVRSLPWASRKASVRHGYAIGQNMYTPRDISLAVPPADDRPYAGWLYGTVGLATEAGDQFVQAAVTLGVVGPATRAGQVQAAVHKITGSDRPQGWDTQLSNEPGIVLAYQQARRNWITASHAELGFDVTPYFGGALGNVYTYGGAGLTARYGHGLPAYTGSPRSQPAFPASRAFVPTPHFSWYVFATVDGRAVARNIFLDGNTFKDSPGVDRVPFVADVQAGAVFTWRSMQLTYFHVIRTREFSTQGSTSGFGGLSLAIAL